MGLLRAHDTLHAYRCCRPGIRHYFAHLPVCTASSWLRCMECFTSSLYLVGFVVSCEFTTQRCCPMPTWAARLIFLFAHPSTALLLHCCSMFFDSVRLLTLRTC